MHDSKNQETCQTLPLFAVYVIWCRITNMHYVGVTRQQVKLRIRQHKKGKQQFIDKEIRRLGWEGNFDWWLVETHIPADQISDCEQKWVKFFDCVFPNGYNKTCGGISKLTVSDDTCEKIRQNALARNLSGENNPMYGKHHTDEVKAAQSARMKGENNPNYGKPPANKGVPHTEEHKAKISAAVSGEKNGFFGKHHTEEAKEKNRQAHLGKPSWNKGVPCREETKAILRDKATARDISGENNPFFGKKHTEESKEKNRQKQLGRIPWNKGKKMTEEQKAVMREKGRATKAAKRAAKAAAEENRAAANTTPTNLTNLLDAVILQKGLSSEIAVA